MKKKLAIIFLIITIFPILLCGCWNYSEIDTLAIVTGLAIDKNIITNKYIITIEVVTSESQGSTSTISSKLYSSEGSSIFNAERNMVSKVSLALFWSQAKVIIIGESVANDGLIPVIDWIHRDSDLRSDMWLLISKNTPAAEILKANIKPNEIVSFNLDNSMNIQKLLSTFPASMLYSFINGLSSEGKPETVAVVRNDIENGIITPRVGGSAIFKSDKLAGYLDDSESLYMLMVQNKIQEGLITIKKILGTDTNITLEIFKNKTKLTPVYKDGTARLIIDISPVVIIAEVEGTEDLITDENLTILQSEAENRIKDNVLYFINKIQKDCDSDILGFGRIFEKNKPKVYDEFKKRGENIFTSVETEVNVHLQIKGSGRTSSPLPKQK
jgi:spore germination protein KC